MYIVQVLLELQHLVANGVHLPLCFAVRSFCMFTNHISIWQCFYFEVLVKGYCCYCSCNVYQRFIGSMLRIEELSDILFQFQG